MRAVLPVLFLAVLAMGFHRCRRERQPYVEYREKFPVINLGRTLADLQYHEVLNNIAMLQFRNLRLPVPPAAFSHGPAFNPSLELKFLCEGYPAEDARELALDPRRQVMLEYAYQRAIGFHFDVPVEEEMSAFFKNNARLYAALTSGWYSMGGLREVPSGVAYIGSYNGLYVWVYPYNVPSLAQFTFALDYIVRGGGTPMLHP